MVTLPVWPSGLNAADKSGDTATIFGAGSQLLWWDPTASVYRPYADYRVPRIGPGRGYWLYTTSSHTATYPGVYPFVKTAHKVVAHLYPGWNLIGTPGNNSVAWNWDNIQVRYYNTNVTNATSGGMEIIKSLTQAAAANWIKPYAQRYNTGSGLYEYVTDTRSSSPSSSIHQLSPAEGYWIQSLVECELLLPYQ